MNERFVDTRSSFGAKHALICPDSHVITPLSNWLDCDLTFAISPQIGACFTLYFARMPHGASGDVPIEPMERFFFVLDGKVNLAVEGQTSQLAAEGYAFLPSGVSHKITAEQDSDLMVLERSYIAQGDQQYPSLHVGDCTALTAEPIQGDEMLMLKKLMPEGFAYDFEVNTMDFAPGGSLPHVETHFMEHGLIFLNGGGVYRLEDRWYPVRRGDTIWMGPYCPQWFGAIGSENARYLIYKNWNRDPHSG